MLRSNSEQAVGDLHAFFRTNKLKLNSCKTTYLKFTYSYNLNRMTTIINACDSSVSESHSVNFLGVHLDSHLNWSKQVDAICGKLSSANYLLWVLQSYLPSEALLMVYFGVVLPYISYGIEFWGGAARVLTERVFVLQKKALRTIFKLKPTESCRQVFKDNKILTLYSLHVMRSILLFRGQATEFKQNSEIHSHNTRSRQDIHLYRNKLVRSDSDPFRRGAFYFNKLPSHIKGMQSFVFKRNLKLYLIGKNLYSMNEF